MAYDGRMHKNFLLLAGILGFVGVALGVGIVVAVITYASLILGELVPKQIALRNPEGVAVKVAPAMTILAKVAAPLVWLLDISGRGVLRLLGQKEESEEKVTDEEIKMLVAEAEHHGTIESDERRMIEQALKEADGRVAGSAGAAARLGVPASTLESKIKRFSIDKLRYRGRS